MRARVGQFMTWGAITARPEQLLVEALATMEERGVHHLVVVDDQGVLRGVLTGEGGLLAIHREPRSRQGLSRTTVAEAMTSAPLPGATPETPLREAAQRMLAYGATALPIQDEATGELVGIMTARDLLAAFVAGATVRHPED